MHNDKFVIFDFCGTLIQFQTADRYVQYCCERIDTHKIRVKKRILRILEVLRVFKIAYHLKPGNNWHKKLVLWQLKGIKQSRCESLAKEYFENELLPNVVNVSIQQLQQHLEEGHKVWILSGGYGIYIRYFVEHFGIHGYIASEIDFVNGRCMGKMKGADCMRANKVEYFRSLPTHNSKTIFYTDSISDLPLLKVVNQGVVVSRKESQEWVNQYNFKELIWS